MDDDNTSFFARTNAVRDASPLAGIDALLSTTSNKEMESSAIRDYLYKMTLLACRQSFYAYVCLMGPVVVPGFIDSPHIRVVCDALQKAYEVPNSRLMVFLPPGASKSVLGSILFPSWVYGRSPSYHLLHVGHGADFIAVFGGKIRDLIMTPEYEEIFPETKINANMAGKDTWETTSKGRYWSAGVGGRIAGKRGNIGIVDDVITEQDYNSKNKLTEIYTWWPHGFESRLLTGGSIIVINTRWACLHKSSKIELPYGILKNINEYTDGEEIA